jgi:flagellar hook-length control protein FliK
MPFIPIHQEKVEELHQRVLPAFLQNNMNFNKEKDKSDSKRELNFDIQHHSNSIDKKTKQTQNISINPSHIPKSITKRITFNKNIETVFNNLLNEEIEWEDELITLVKENISKRPVSKIRDNYHNLGTRFSKVEIKTTAPKTSVSETIPKEVIYEFIEEAYLHFKSDRSEIRIKLKPEYLGKLELRVTQQNDKISAKFVVGNIELKQWLEAELDSLKEIFLEKGLDLESIEVYVGNEPEKSLERKYQKYADNIRTLSYHEDSEEEKGGDEKEIWIDVDPNGNKLFWFISKIDLIA